MWIYTEAEQSLTSRTHAWFAVWPTMHTHSKRFEACWWVFYSSGAQHMCRHPHQSVVTIDEQGDLFYSAGQHVKLH